MESQRAALANALKEMAEDVGNGRYGTDGIDVEAFAEDLMESLNEATPPSKAFSVTVAEQEINDGTEGAQG